MLEKLDALKGSEPVWVEVHYTGANKADSLADTVRKEVEGSNVQVLKICDDTQLLRIREEQEEAKDISLLSVDDVFSMKLDESGYEPTMKDHLMQLFHAQDRCKKDGQRMVCLSGKSGYNRSYYTLLRFWYSFF